MVVGVCPTRMLAHARAYDVCPISALAHSASDLYVFVPLVLQLEIFSRPQKVSTPKKKYFRDQKKCRPLKKQFRDQKKCRPLKRFFSETKKILRSLKNFFSELVSIF